jgi:hypothetical protein
MGMVADGQQTPGTTRFLKQTDWRNFSTLNMSHMHFRTSLHSPGSPSGVLQKLIDGRGRNRFGIIPVLRSKRCISEILRKRVVSGLTLTSFSFIRSTGFMIKDEYGDDGNDDMMLE